MYLHFFSEEKTLSFHIRFCNDNGRRSWSKTIEHYFGKDDILLKYPDCLVSIFYIIEINMMFSVHFILNQKLNLIRNH